MIKFFQAIKLWPLILYKILIRNWQIATLLILGIVIVIFFITKADLKPNNLSLGLIGTFQEHSLPDAVTVLLSPGLVELDESYHIIPKLVSGWEVNSDATIFKFKLSRDLKWSDSTPFRAQDLEFNIPDVEVSYLDDLTIQFKLKGSFSPFPSLLTKPVFKKQTLIGVGPYRISKIEKSRVFITKIRLEPTDLSSSLPRLVIRFYPNEKIALTAFDLGEIQSVIGVVDLTHLSGNPLAKFKSSITYERIVTILYNTKDNFLSNRSLRQALSYSAPAIAGETPAKTSLPPSSWAYSEDVNDYLSNEEAAKAALSRATDSTADIKKEIVLTSTPQLEYVGKQVVASWQNLGLNAVLRVESGIPQNFQALLIGQTIPSDPDQYSLWHSTQTKTNLTKYSSARVDKDLEDGRKLMKEEERRSKYIDFQKTLLEDSPATFLYFPKINVIYLKKKEEQLNKILPMQLAI